MARRVRLLRSACVVMARSLVAFAGFASSAALVACGGAASRTAAENVGAPRRTLPPLPPPEIPPPSDLVPIDRCSDTGEGFADWVVSFRQRAIQDGVEAELVERALGHVEYDPEVIELDRAQSHQKRSFEEYAASHVTPLRVQRAKHHLGKDAGLLTKITTRFGVPKEIVVAIWGLETDFGLNQGSTRSLRALATLAYDCRRAERFRGELSSALRILKRGDLTVESMVGAWAGELGQTQFLPSSYERYGIDFDGDGRVDLVHSTEDALASTAHYLAEHGWRAGERYAQGTANFDVLAEWNKSETYRKTIVLFASKLVTRR